MSSTADRGAGVKSLTADGPDTAQWHRAHRETSQSRKIEGSRRAAGARMAVWSGPVPNPDAPGSIVAAQAATAQQPGLGGWVRIACRFGWVGVQIAPAPRSAETFLIP